MRGRALVVCLDGTSNQFGKNNTNVIELYHRIIKDKRQLTYYNSGIGTYAKPSWRSFTYWKQVISNKIDTAIAWNLEKIILGAYRWLSANYKEGDRIYLFGFSRGAYQVRALAGMIKKVGLILRGNEEQIPFAYELYADHKSEEDTAKTFNMAARFKETFSRPGVKVHYIGVWDTVSSIGLARSKSLPLTDTCEHFCYMRHALALDERRVKFQPEYARGGESWVPTPAQQANPNTPKSRPRVKEVWFAGSHSDINTELNNASIPALWMGNEAMLAGLDLTASRAEWDWNKLKEDRPTESLSVVWWFLEVFLFKQLSYKGTRSTRRYFPCRLILNLAKTISRRFHLADPRIIKPGQKIHASVAFVGSGYHPKAKFSKEAPKNQWNHIVGKGNKWNPEWAHGLGDLLELDLFDHSDIPNIMGNLSRESRRDTKVEYLDKLAFMARSRTSPSQTISEQDKSLTCNFL
ncbi:hypothetical protein BD779DRAFT_1451418 [Infundibulicybe gibba]|nr:hypothetical protein BD779DRAFT_1451418 [Infundibulicybe gibba]